MRGDANATIAPSTPPLALALSSAGTWQCPCGDLDRLRIVHSADESTHREGNNTFSETAVETLLTVVLTSSLPSASSTFGAACSRSFAMPFPPLFPPLRSHPLFVCPVPLDVSTSLWLRKIVQSPYSILRLYAFVMALCYSWEH